MTLNEFKAWLDGFIAGIPGEPNREHLDMIAKKAAEISAGYDYAPPPSVYPSPYVAPPVLGPQRWGDLYKVYCVSGGVQ